MSIRISGLNALDILGMPRSTSGWSALPESVQTVQRNLARRPEEPASNYGPNHNLRGFWRGFGFFLHGRTVLMPPQACCELRIEPGPLSN
jgi:hypothetical protein